MINKTVSDARIKEKLHGYGAGVAYKAEDTRFGFGVPSVLRKLARGGGR